MEDSIPEINGEPFSQAGLLGFVKGAGSQPQMRGNIEGIKSTVLRYWVLG